MAYCAQAHHIGDYKGSVAEMLTLDEDELMTQIIQDSLRLKAMQLIAQTA